MEKNKLNFNQIIEVLKKKKGLRFFILRLIIFLSLVTAIPHILKLIAKYNNLKESYSANYVYTSLFLFAVTCIFIIYTFDKIKNINYYKQSLKETLIFLYLSFVFYGIYFIMSYLLNMLFVILYVKFLIIARFFILMLAAIFLALAIFNLQTIKKFSKEITITSSISFLSFMLIMIIRNNWHFFSSLIVKITAFILGLKFDNVYYNLNGDPLLYVNGFSAIVGAACSGIDSMSMFTGLFVLMYFLDYAKINKKKLLPIFAVGLSGMYLMSVIRIAVLFYVGTFNRELALTLFHENLGWVLFIAYFMLYMFILHPLMYIKRNEQKKQD